MAGVRGELVEWTLMASVCCYIGITGAPLQWAIGHLQGWPLLGIFGKQTSVFPRTPGCRITVPNTLLQSQPDAISSAPHCFQQLDHCWAAVSCCCAISWLTQPQGCLAQICPILSHTGVTTGIGGKSLGACTKSGDLCGTGDFSGARLGVGTVPLSSLAPYLQWWTQRALSELPAVSETWLGWIGCVWLMGSEPEGGCGITLGNELDIFNASTEVSHLNTFCWPFSVPPPFSCLYFKDLYVRLVL